MRLFGHDWATNRRASARNATFFLAFAPAFLLGGLDAKSQTNVVLTNLSQIQALPLQDGAAGLPVKLRAVVTYIDPEWRMCFLHDAGGGAYLERLAGSDDPSWNLPSGEMVEVDGVTTKGVIQCNVKE